MAFGGEGVVSGVHVDPSKAGTTPCLHPCVGGIGPDEARFSRGWLGFQISADIAGRETD